MRADLVSVGDSFMFLASLLLQAWLIRRSRQADKGVEGRTEEDRLRIIAEKRSADESSDTVASN